MLFRYGKYNKLFRPSGLILPGYLSLLNLYDKEADTALDQLEFANKNGGKQKHIDRMLSGKNWRPHLVACCALLLDREGRFTTDSLWECLKRGSWVSPQLVVSASLRETEFEARTAELLKSLPAKPSTFEKCIAQYDSEDYQYLNDISLSYSKLINSLHVYEKGSTEEAMDLYVKFRGAKPKIDALLKVRGLDGSTD